MRAKGQGQGIEAEVADERGPCAELLTTKQFYWYQPISPSTASTFTTPLFPSTTCKSLKQAFKAVCEGDREVDESFGLQKSQWSRYLEQPRRLSSQTRLDGTQQKISLQLDQRLHASPQKLLARASLPAPFSSSSLGVSAASASSSSSS